MAERKQRTRKVKLGVIEFHPNEQLRKRFYEVVDDLRNAGCIVDLWILDIAMVLAEFGYSVEITQKLSSKGE